MTKDEPLLEYNGQPDREFVKHVVEEYKGVGHIRIESNEDALSITVTRFDPV